MGEPSADLGPLIDRVAALVGVLELDPACPWTDGFRDWLAEAQADCPAASRDDAVGRAAAAMRLFAGGMGGFNDYVPQRAGAVLPWAGRVHELGGEVFAAALAVRAVGSVPDAEPLYGQSDLNKNDESSHLA
ncbi:MAG: hypothetical protein U0791_18385 [Gemmataceae bacterium]